MASNTDQSDANNDLKSLPLEEVEKKLGSSPDGLTQAEAQKRLAQYGPNSGGRSRG
jgi:H+-transporting ATPase